MPLHGFFPARSSFEELDFELEMVFACTYFARLEDGPQEKPNTGSTEWRQTDLGAYNQSDHQKFVPRPNGA